MKQIRACPSHQPSIRYNFFSSIICIRGDKIRLIDMHTYMCIIKVNSVLFFQFTGYALKIQ